LETTSVLGKTNPSRRMAQILEVLGEGKMDDYGCKVFERENQNIPYG
jgi:hypothetical protein